MKAIWNGKILAESDETVIVEGNHYFPVNTLHREFFSESNSRTVCPWKGTASYYNIKVGNEENTDAAWYYPEPSEAAKMIKDKVAFWKGVEVVS